MSKLTSLHLLLFALLLSFQGFAQQGDGTTKELETKWLNMKAYTLEVADLMPKEFYGFKPTPEQMSFEEQLIHMAGNIERLSYNYLLTDGEADKDSVPDSKAAVIRELNDAFDLGLKAHQSLPQEQLDEKVSFFAGPMTKRQIRELLHAHQTHHLGQLVVYLRLKGINPPAYVGW